jgi:hypothetical protein
VIDFHMVDGAPGHSLIQRGLQGLNDGGAAVLLDGEKPRRAVVEIARKHYSDNPAPVTMGGGPKQRIDCRPMTVLFGTTGQPGLSVGEVQVTIRRGDIYPAGLNGLAIDGMTSRKWSGPVQNTGQGAGNGPREVDHYED